VDVESQRRGYPDEREGRWYPGDSGYSDRYEEERYRLPEPRHAEPGGHPLDPHPGAVGPRSGVELPPLPTYDPGMPYGPDEPDDPTGEHHTTPIERSSLRRPDAPVKPPSPTVYKSRRAGALIVVTAVAAVIELLLLPVLLAGEFGHDIRPGAVLASLFAMAGVPFVAVGLYALITGPAATAGPEAARAWLRTPLAYLPVGLVLLVAAGLAAR
jgi:hypothetical protein